MSSVLGVVGSPRKKGNTHLLVERILDGAQNEGAATEMLFLNDLTIKACDGCHLCWRKGRCSKKDDMAGLYQKIILSDAIVFGTPVYWYGPTALMKAFIDRFVYFNCPENRPGVQGKQAALAIPFEEEDLNTVAPLVEFFQSSLRFLEMNLMGRIVVPGVTVRGEIAKKKDRLEAAYELGMRLARLCNDGTKAASPATSS